MTLDFFLSSGMGILFKDKTNGKIAGFALCAAWDVDKLPNDIDINSDPNGW